jgi:septal ring factor EnvC (AmiA/AmiB activator)
MKRFYLAIFLVYCLTLPVWGQTGKKKSTTPKKKSTTQKTASSPTTNPKIQEIQIPVRVYSIQELGRQRKATLEDIELTSQLLNETSATAKNSLNRLNLLAQQLLSRKKVLAILGQEIVAIDQKVKTLNDDIDLLGKDLARTKENYAKSMQNQQQEHRTAQYKILFILSAENFSQSYRRMRYLREYSNWQKEEAGRIIEKQNEIANRKTELENSRKEKQELLTQRERENEKAENEKRLQQREVRNLNRKQKDLQLQLREKKKQADALNKQIESLIAEDMDHPEKKAPVSASDTSAKLSGDAQPVAAKEVVMTESEVNLAKNFADNKGLLPFPLNGQYAIVSGFGQHQHQELTYVKTNNNGIDIQTTAGAEARTIFKGVVTRVFIMPGYNNNVIIRHGDYRTVYSNLSRVYVKPGDIVETRQAIGVIFTDTEKGNETILHFQIWKERTKLNPAAWIR